MNENIDLTKILKDCPIGWKFYSSVYGEVKFEAIKFLCLENRYEPCAPTSNFLTYEEDKHPIKFTENGVEHSVSKSGKHIYGKGECTLFPSREQRDWSKFTAPWYKKDKFNPKTLNPFDKVLARDSYSQDWTCGLFSHIYIFNNVCKYNVGEILYKMCIPYNDETKHLVGTTEEAPEYYRYLDDCI